MVFHGRPQHALGQSVPDRRGQPADLASTQSEATMSSRWPPWVDVTMKVPFWEGCWRMEGEGQGRSQGEVITHATEERHFITGLMEGLSAHSNSKILPELLCLRGVSFL